MPYCAICQVSCPSDYQMRQHLSGRKHAASLKFGKKSSGEVKGVCFQFQKIGMCSKGALCSYKHIGRDARSIPPSRHNEDSYSWTNTSLTKRTKISARSGPPPLGICYLWWQNGVCSKDAMCTYKHELPDKSEDNCNLIFPSEIGHSKEKVGLSTDFFLCKTNDPDKSNINNETSNKNTLAKPAPTFCTTVKEEEKQGKTFPDEYLNLLSCKRGVNLFIENGSVIWEFAYDAKVIKAIKDNIKGRAWNPNLGAKGCWTLPLESLPDAIALYEHMGRSASTELKKRSKEIQEQFGGSSASDVIKFHVEISLCRLENKAKMGFEDHESSFGSVTVTFLYDADVVSAMKMLAPTQRTYDPVSKAWKIDLLALPNLLENLLPLGYNAPKRLRELASHAYDADNLLYGEIKTISNKAADSLGVPPPFQQNVKIEAGAACSSADEIMSNDESGERTQSIEYQTGALEARLKAIVELVAQDDGKLKSLDISDCGKAKKRKLTNAEGKWDGDLDTQEYLYTKGALSAFARNRLKSVHSENWEIKLNDCDCGRPSAKVGGKHTCRYFGTFQCSCGNRWTSAYCWKGEMQACRRCDAESLPVKKDILDGRIGGGTGAPHDSARCGRCHTLGYNCSGFGF